ncbi:MAG: serine hydrolase domain-containing protein [Gemmatimonadota bacterium]
MMLRPLTAVCVLALLAACGEPPTSAPDPDPVDAVELFGVTGDGLASVDRVIVDLLRQWQIPGATLAVARDGRLVVARGYGRNVGDADALVAPDARGRVASLSKPITSAAVLKLVESGVLRLDDAVFGEWLAAPDDPDPRLGDITIDHLLTHRGGWNPFVSLDPMFNPRLIAQARGVPSPPDFDDILAFMAERDLEFSPGTDVQYSNFGYSVLARVIEAASHETYEDFVRREVVGPAGITGMEIGGTLEDERLPGEMRYRGLASEAVLMPSVFDDRPGPVPYPYGGFYLRPMDGHGGWVSSAIDLVRFGLAMDGDAGIPDLLAPEVRGLVDAAPVPLGGGSYGYGWFVSGAEWHHSGRLPGSASRLVIEGDGTVYAMLLNASHPNEGAFLGDVVRTLEAAMDGVSAWPDHDLFDQYPPTPGS